MKRRLLRGGSYYDLTGILRSSYSYWGVPENRNKDRAFRIVVVTRRSNE